MTLDALLQAAHGAKLSAALATEQEKNETLYTMADALEQDAQAILEANAIDLEAARCSISEVMLDRLRLTQQRIIDMAQAMRAVAQLPDPVGYVDERITHANGMQIEKVRVPMGVIAIIYESRPNVTADAAALCVKSGNVCVLRGGKEAIATNRAIVAALHRGLDEPARICLVEDTARESAVQLMQARGLVDLLIPRGGAGLIRTCVEQAKVPCIETGTGICHIYIDCDANFSMALQILDNAKTSRPSVCNAAEVCLVHAAIAPTVLPQIAQLFAQRVQLRLCPRALEILPQAGIAAQAEDFDTEFLDYILAVRVVDDVEEAIAHIAKHSTGHSEAIITENAQTAQRFCAAVDSAAVYVNASTRFTDGGEFGLGCEMGISTQKLGARGPMGLREMTSYQYIVRGSGQVR